jgi:hypothetical protein
MSIFLELLGVLSFFTFVGSLLAVPWLIARLPSDYFITHHRKVANRHRRHPILALFLFLLRNACGFLLLLAGIAMLMLPGQGILTIVVGLSLLDFPGKQKLLDILIRQPKVIGVLNWIRKKEKKTPFVFEE